MLQQMQVPPKMERALALTALRQRNEQNFKTLGLINPPFTIKFAYIPKHRKDVVISMFPSEMEHEEGIYIELVDSNNNPVYEKPVLYRMRKNPFYKQEYELIPADPSKNKKSDTYLVPLSELEIVAGASHISTVSDNSKQFKNFSEKLVESFVTAGVGEESKEKEDAHQSELTVRDIAAIFLKAPVSNKSWLNDIINKHR